MTEQEKFNEAYWLSFQPEVRVLQQIAGGDPKRQQLALELAQSATHKIDCAIHYFGLDPFLTMKQRLYYGYKWTPNIMQPAPIWDTNGWTSMMDLALMPAGAIKNSIDLADWPAYNPPKPPLPPDTSASPSDVWLSGTMRAIRNGDLSPVGTTWKDQTGKIWTKTARINPFGTAQWWQVEA